MQAETELAGVRLPAPNNAGTGREQAGTGGEFPGGFEANFEAGWEGFSGDEAEAFAGLVEGGGDDETAGSAGFVDPEADFGLVGEGDPAPGAAVRDGGFRHGGLFDRERGIESKYGGGMVVEIGKGWW